MSRDVTRLNISSEGQGNQQQSESLTSGPPRDEYLNLHEHCFHLWEIDPDPRFT